MIAAVPVPISVKCASVVLDQEISMQMSPEKHPSQSWPVPHDLEVYLCYKCSLLLSLLSILLTHFDHVKKLQIDTNYDIADALSM